MRYILQPSEKQNAWVCTDQANMIVCVFENGKFNETQQFTMLENFTGDIKSVALCAREMGDWLRNNHYEKLF